MDREPIPWHKRAMADPAKKSVVIIGGGLMGTSAALGLAERGFSVTVLEKALPGAEASSAAAGILGPEIENVRPGPLLELCRMSRRLYPEWIRRLHKATSLDTDFHEGGSFDVAFSEAELKDKRTRRAFQTETRSGEDLSGDEARQRIAALSEEAKGAIHFPDDAHIAPRKLFRATRIAAERAGVTIRSGVGVRGLDFASSEQKKVSGVLLDDGSKLRADWTVVAAGSWTPLVSGLPLERGAIVPARGQVIELDGHFPRFQSVLFGSDIYMVPRSDGRVVVGSTLEFVGYQKAVTAQGVHRLLSGAMRLVPSLAQAELVDSWSNFRPYTPDERPIVGTFGIEGLIVASGHYRMGILLAPITAQIVLSLAEGRPAPLDLAPFEPRRSFAGSAAR
ncbi:MAG: glycine oxidase ThiO [Sorangiineae bacterium NIC37A_2]|nr:MAG: glycine oxidase ThiO [Sorangiineae bacterium NIC37A_2]